MKSDRLNLEFGRFLLGIARRFDMYILDTDYGLKYIITEINGEEITVMFRYSLLRGVYNADIFGKNVQSFKIKNTYPGIAEVIRDAAFTLGHRLVHLVKCKS